MPIASRRALLVLIPVLAIAACAPKAGGPYDIFFDDESATLTPKARSLIAEAAKEAKNWGAKSINVDGFAGKDGARDAHEALSVKRAEAVAAELVANGVSPDLIHRVEGHGDAGAIAGVTVGERRVEIRIAY
ncbi:MAG: OmpA family protein [Inquilinus limosus]|uniref:OmpA family protein n=1 Tax=Inquilinus limosus TaxID=171674 RepID=A0A952FU28_9PROT|nr:OmpA family protein [Inquilinus limosus]